MMSGKDGQAVLGFGDLLAYETSYEVVQEFDESLDMDN